MPDAWISSRISSSLTEPDNQGEPDSVRDDEAWMEDLGDSDPNMSTTSRSTNRWIDGLMDGERQRDEE